MAAVTPQPRAAVHMDVDEEGIDRAAEVALAIGQL